MAWSCCGQTGLPDTGTCPVCETDGPGRAAELARRAASLVGNPEARQRAADLDGLAVYGAPHPADDDGWLATHPGLVDDEAPTVAGIGADFWAARPVLGMIRQHAYARMVSPWAALGEVLTRVMTFVPPQVQLPGIVGGPASLNLLLAVVCRPGVGKGGAARCAEQAVIFPQPVRAYPIGTGEGLVDTFATTDTQGEQTWHTTSAHFSVPEIDQLTAESSRSSATIGPYLRQAYMGESLGGSYRTKTSKAHLPPHSYRLTMAVGVQAKRAGTLMSEADGGTPQRFLWLPGACHQPDRRPDAPPAVEWKLPASLDAVNFSDGQPCLVDVCAEAWAKCEADQRARQNGDPFDPMETHSNLTRLKWAAALAVLCADDRGGLPSVTAEFWDLAGMLIEVSRITRCEILEELSAELRAQNEAAGYAEASRAEIVADRAENRELAKTRARVIVKLRERPGWWSRNDLRTAIGPRYRDMFNDAIDALVASGDIDREEIKYHNTAGWRYRAAGADEG